MPSLFLAAFLALAIKTLAATIPLVNSISLAGIDTPLLNVTWLDAIDRRFTATTQLQGPALDVDAFLLSVIEAMTTYALSDFTADVTPVMVGSPDVMIVPRGMTPGGTIEARFLVWGLYAGVRGLIFCKIFDTVELTLKWAGNVVGHIKIMKPNAQSLGASNDTTALTLHSSRSPSTSMNETDISDTSLQLPDRVAIHDLEVRFTSFGQPLGRDEVIITILRTLLIVAPEDSNHLV